MKKILLIAIAAVALGLSACGDWKFWQTEPSQVEIKGAKGSTCTEDWNCVSNKCAYPGRCE